MAQYQLNVVLHGTWGIENNLYAIRLVTIDDYHHVIKAGDRENPAYDLRKNKEYQLVGVTRGASQSFNAEQNATIDPKIDFPNEPNRQVHANIANVKVVIDLDYPREIHSVRRQETKGEKFFETLIPRTPPKMSVAQVLVYDVEDIDALRLEGSNWRPPKLNAGDGTINLHLFADPDKELIQKLLDEERDHPHKKKHFVEVFENLGKAFGLDMTPLKLADVSPRLEDNIEGLDKYDTIALFERSNRAALSPANCDMCVFNNRGI